MLLAMWLCHVDGKMQYDAAYQTQVYARLFNGKLSRAVMCLH